MKESEKDCTSKKDKLKKLRENYNKTLAANQIKFGLKFPCDWCHRSFKTEKEVKNHYDDQQRRCDCKEGLMMKPCHCFGNVSLDVWRP